MTPGERLFKDVLSDDDYLDDFDQKKKFKAFTLCMICNPSSYDQPFNQWKDSINTRNDKKIVVNSSAY